MSCTEYKPRKEVYDCRKLNLEFSQQFEVIIKMSYDIPAKYLYEIPLKNTDHFTLFSYLLQESLQ